MPVIAEEKQHEITSQHLKGNMEIEVWLIPFCITVSLVVIAMVVMVTLHILKQRRKNTEELSDYRPANTGDSDEMLTFSPVEDGDLPNGVADFKKNEEMDNSTENHEWPPRVDSAGGSPPAWGGLPSSNL